MTPEEPVEEPFIDEYEHRVVQLSRDQARQFVVALNAWTNSAVNNTWLDSGAYAYEPSPLFAEWQEDHGIGSVEIVMSFKWKPNFTAEYMVDFAFETPKDAMAFKMSWL